jgi:hypothetical protein
VTELKADDGHWEGKGIKDGKVMELPKEEVDDQAARDISHVPCCSQCPHWPACARSRIRHLSLLRALGVPTRTYREWQPHALTLDSRRQCLMP